MKTRPVMNRHEKFVNAIMALSDLPLMDEIRNITEEFSCNFYGYMKQTNIHGVISQKPFNCIKSIETTTFPPCIDVLIKHIKRCWLIAKLYKMAAQPFPLEGLTPFDYRCILSSNFLTVKWFDGYHQVTDVTLIKLSTEMIMMLKIMTLMI